MKLRPHKGVCFISIALVFVFTITVPLRAASDTNDQPEVRVHFKTRMKAGINYAEAIEAFKQLRDYFNAKFQPESNSGYIEKTSEGNIIHIFTDYKDFDAYKKAHHAHKSSSRRFPDL